MIVMKVDPYEGWTTGGHAWWEVGTPEVSDSETVRDAHNGNRIRASSTAEGQSQHRVSALRRQQLSGTSDGQGIGPLRGSAGSSDRGSAGLFRLGGSSANIAVALRRSGGARGARDHASRTTPSDASAVNELKPLRRRLPICPLCRRGSAQFAGRGGNPRRGSSVDYLSQRRGRLRDEHGGCRSDRLRLLFRVDCDRHRVGGRTFAHRDLAAFERARAAGLALHLRHRLPALLLAFGRGRRRGLRQSRRSATLSSAMMSSSVSWRADMTAGSIRRATWPASARRSSFTKWASGARSPSRGWSRDPHRDIPGRTRSNPPAPATASSALSIAALASGRDHRDGGRRGALRLRRWWLLALVARRRCRPRHELDAFIVRRHVLSDPLKWNQSMHIPPYDNHNQPIVDVNHPPVPLNYFNIVKLKQGDFFDYRTPGYETLHRPARPEQ